MQMLAAGGVECIGHYPAFEDDRSINPTPAFLASATGKAVKVLEPRRNLASASAFDAFGFWLDRDPKERAKSAMRFFPPDARGADARSCRRILARSYVRERATQITALRRVCRRGIATVNFETLITEPAIAARSLAKILDHLGFSDIRETSMRQRVEPRSPACTEVMLEPYLIEIGRIES